MSFYVPPHALYTVHGNLKDPTTWERSRVMFIDEDGDAWIVGDEPSFDEDWAHRGAARQKKLAHWCYVNLGCFGFPGVSDFHDNVTQHGLDIISGLEEL